MMGTTSKDESIGKGSLSFFVWPQEFAYLQRMNGGLNSGINSESLAVFLAETLIAFVRAFEHGDIALHPSLEGSKSSCCFLSIIKSSARDAHKQSVLFLENGKRHHVEQKHEPIQMVIPILESTYNLLDWMESSLEVDTETCIRYLIHFAFWYHMARIQPQKKLLATWYTKSHKDSKDIGGYFFEETLKFSVNASH